MFDLHSGWSARLGLVLGIIGVATIGGTVEIVPLFTIHQTVEDAPDMRVYTPLEIAAATSTSAKAATPAIRR